MSSILYLSTTKMMVHVVVLSFQCWWALLQFTCHPSIILLTQQEIFLTEFFLQDDPCDVDKSTLPLASFASLLLDSPPPISPHQDTVQLSSSTLHSPSPPAPPTYWIRNLDLRPADENQLLEGQWLTDKHVYAAGKLLTKQFPGQNGLQDTLVLNKKLLWSSNPTDFIQIVNLNNQHWICISNIGCLPGVVDVFDSIPSYSVGSSSLKSQVAAILRPRETSFTLQFVDTQRQSGSNDCALLAIDFATALCHQQDPQLCTYDQGKMRSHLHQAFKQGILTPFPPSLKPRRRGRDRKLTIQTVQVYCKCRQPWNKRDEENGGLVQCTACHEWYHEKRENIDSALVGTTLPWYCSKCT